MTYTILCCAYGRNKEQQMKRLLSIFALCLLSILATAQLPPPPPSWPIMVTLTSQNAYQEPGNAQPITYSADSGSAMAHAGIQWQLSGSSYTGGEFHYYSMGGVAWQWAAMAPILAPYSGIVIKCHLTSNAQGHAELDVEHTHFFNQAAVSASSSAQDSAGAVTVSDGSSSDAQSYADPRSLDFTINVPFSVVLVAGVPFLEADFGFGTGTIKAKLDAIIGGMTSPWSMSNWATADWRLTFSVSGVSPKPQDSGGGGA